MMTNEELLEQLAEALRSRRPCKPCSGTGYSDYDKPPGTWKRQCTACNGAGEVLNFPAEDFLTALREAEALT